MSYLFFDTETTTLPSIDLPANHPSQAHICQLAAILTDEKYNELASLCVLIKPRGWFMSSKAEERHGIPISKCEEYGEDILLALGLFNSLFRKSRYQCAYSAEFDMKLIDIENEVCSFPKLNWGNLLCPMKPLTPICKLPSKIPGKWKWPKLIEAYEYCFKKKFEKAHDALADVRALCQVFQWCKNNNVTL